MAKKAKKVNGKAKVAAKPEQPKEATKAKRGESKLEAEVKRQAPDLDALRRPVLAARTKLDAAEAEAKALLDKAEALVAAARGQYREALAPYRQACSKAGVECEFEGGRSTNVSPKVSFIVEKADKGIRVMVRGKPESEEIIPLAALKASIGKVAYAYTDKHVGPRERVGNKGGTLGNKLRAVMTGKR
jgi:multidrug efflux pump subunit AcrA (membrane-fusion protein)